MKENVKGFLKEMDYRIFVFSLLFLVLGFIAGTQSGIGRNSVTQPNQSVDRLFPNQGDNSQDGDTFPYPGQDGDSGTKRTFRNGPNTNSDNSKKGAAGDNATQKIN